MESHNPVMFQTTNQMMVNKGNILLMIINGWFFLMENPNVPSPSFIHQGLRQLPSHRIPGLDQAVARHGHHAVGVRGEDGELQGHGAGTPAGQRAIASRDTLLTYPLVNCCITMENHHF